MNIKYEVAQKQVISAQRAVPGKQAAAEPEADAAKVSAGQQALGNCVVHSHAKHGVLSILPIK